MQLRQWLKDNHVVAEEFGRRIERTGVAVRRYVNGTRIPDREAMAAIVAATGGAVTANDFYPTTQGSPAPVGVDAAPSPRPSPTRGEGEEGASAAARRVAGGR